MGSSGRRYRRPFSFETMERRLVLASYVVDNPLDVDDGDFSPGEFTLREAVSLANSNAGEDSISFDMLQIGSHISLTNSADLQSALVVTDDLVINGPGSGQLTIDASPLDPTPNDNNGDGRRVFDFSPGVTFEMNGVTLTGGDTNGRGGAIQARGPFDLNDVVITNNAGTLGGGLAQVENFTDTSTITGSQFIDNEGTFRGGGIHNYRSSLVINDSVFVGNDGSSAGGGILNYGGFVELNDSVVTGNSAQHGGGLSNETNVYYYYYYNSYTMTPYFYYTQYSGFAEVKRTTISDNFASRNGGGLSAGPGTTTRVVDSTLYDNFAKYDGGGVHLDRSNSYPIFIGGEATITNSTVSGNTAVMQGAGIADITDYSYYNLAIQYSTITNNETTNNSYQYSGAGIAIPNGAVANVDASIVAENTKYGGHSSDILQGSSAAISATQSLIGSNRGSNLNTAYLPDGNGNLIGGSVTIDPGLAPLGNNGGPTMTHALLDTSIAIDRVTDLGNAPSADQRGFARQVGNAIDVGSFEYGNNTNPGDFNGDGLYDCADIDALVNAIANGGSVSTYDLTGDSLLNLDDVDHWLAVAGSVNLLSGNPYLYGDANLDGVVDGLDFIEWNTHKFTNNAAWCAGDFNADGVIDGLDFIEWNNNKFQSSSGGSLELPDQSLAERETAWSLPAGGTAEAVNHPRQSYALEVVAAPGRDRMKPEGERQTRSLTEQVFESFGEWHASET